MALGRTRRWLHRGSTAIAGIAVGAALSAATMHLANPWTYLDERDLILVSETCATCRRLLRAIEERPDSAVGWIVVPLDDPSTATSRTLCDRVVDTLSVEHPWIDWVPRTLGCRLLTHSARRYHGDRFAWVPAFRMHGRPIGGDEQMDVLVRFGIAMPDPGHS